jgi:PAS domain S-box-containing protein
VVNVAYPVLSFDGQVQTVVVATFAERWLESWQQRRSLPPGSAVTLLADDGAVLWRTVDGKRAPVSGQSIREGSQEALTEAWLAALAAGESVFSGADLDGVDRLQALTPLQLGDQVAGYLHLGYPVAQLYDQAYRDVRWELALLGVVLVAALALAWWGSERLFLHPLQDLMAAVQRVQEGDLSARVSRVHGLGELTALGDSFDRMADTLQQRELERLQMAERFRAAFESSAIGMGLMTLDGTILAANAAVCRMSGYTEAELLQRNDSQNVYPPDAQVGMDKFAEMLAGQRGYYSVERRYLRKSGEVFWTRLTLSLVRDAAGQPAYLIGMVEDIDEQRRKSAALAESEARFKAVFDSAAVGVAIMTLDRRIVEINPTASRIIGYSPEEIAKINPSELAVEEDRYVDRELFAELVAGQRSQYLVEKRYIHRNGSLFWGRVNFASVRSVDGQPLYIVGMIEDITEEKGAAERLAAQEAEHRALLEQRIAARTEELNRANELLREKAALDAVAAERTRLARELHDAVTQTLFSTTLIADVLPVLWEMNRAEGERRLAELRELTRGALAEMRTLLMELRPNALVEAPLPALLRQLTEAMIGRARIAIELSTEGERRLPPDVQVGLYRIAQEALNNVVKHAHATQAVVTLRLGEPVRLAIADDGAGFDSGAVTADHLGLRIMRERAEAIGARLTVTSEPGEGTQVTVVWQNNP